MPDIQQNDIIQTRIEYRAMFQTDLNVLHWRVKTTPANIEMFSFLSIELLGDMTKPGGFCEGLLAQMSNKIVMTGVYGQVIKPIRFRHVKKVLNNPGAQLDDLRTNNNALSVTEAPLLAGRGRTGRMQIPGIPTNKMADGIWDNAVVTWYTNLVHQFRSFDYAVGTTGVVLEPVLYRPATGVTNKIVSCFGQETVRTMRRRTVGLGQ